MTDSHCPNKRLVYRLYDSGSQERSWVDCGRWSCLSCAAKKRLDIAYRLSEAAPEKVATGRVPPAWARAAAERLKRSKANYVRLALSDESVYILTPEELRGRGWRLTPVPLADALEELLRWPWAHPARQSWRGWKVDTAEAGGRAPLIREAFFMDATLDAALRAARIDPATPYVSNPRRAAARLGVVLGQRPSKGE